MSKLVYGNQVIWTNPPELGHFGIKLRKQIREEEIAAKIPLRRAAHVVFSCPTLPFRKWNSEP